MLVVSMDVLRAIIVVLDEASFRSLSQANHDRAALPYSIHCSSC
jgi:hypothetical protein